MKKKLLASTIFALSVSSSFAQSGNEILALCKSTSKTDNAGCSIFISGVISAYALTEMLYEIPKDKKLICIPPQSTGYQYIDIFTKMMDSKPELRHHPAAGLVILSLRDAFPCKK